MQPGERDARGRVAGLQRDGPSVGGRGLLRTAVRLVDTRERHNRRNLLRTGLRAACLEVYDQLADAPVALPIELRQALKGEGGPGLREHDAGVPLDELRRGRRRRPGMRRPRRALPCHPRAVGRGMAPRTGVEVLRLGSRSRGKRHRDGESSHEDPVDTHRRPAETRTRRGAPDGAEPRDGLGTTHGIRTGPRPRLPPPPPLRQVP